MEESHTYHGKPCKRCGGTLRYVRSCGCVACNLQWRHREKKAATEYITGKPCKVCGETLRYKKDQQCVACRKRKNAIITEKRKAKSALLPIRKPGDQLCLSCGQTKNYFFLDYCRECVNAEKARVPEQHKNFTRCDWCGEWKPYRITGACRACEASHKRHMLRIEAEDKLRELEKRQRRYADPF